MFVKGAILEFDFKIGDYKFYFREDYTNLK